MSSSPSSASSTGTASGMSCFNTSGMSSIARSTLSMVPITCWIHALNNSSMVVPSSMHRRISSPSASSSNDPMALDGPPVNPSIDDRWSFISPDVDFSSKDFVFDSLQRRIDSVTDDKQAPRTFRALARAPQIDPSLDEAAWKSEMSHWMSLPTSSAKACINPESLRHLHALLAAVRTFPMALAGLSGSKSRKDPETVSTSSANFLIDPNMLLESSPFFRNPRKAALPLSTTLNRLTFSTSSTSPFSSSIEAPTSGICGSPFRDPFFLALCILFLTKGSTTSGSASIPFSIDTIISLDFSTHKRDNPESSLASSVACLIRSPSTRSWMISNLDESMPRLPVRFTPTMSSRVDWISLPKFTISEALRMVVWHKPDVSRARS
mmetsp:Transcript_29595/g.63420  ORF Transcript_29595/g.63420 Transcript_29595/m.63420 type:complete len:380 (+) Transcript_29595:1158-2297(+)